MRLAFMGTPDFSVPALNALLDGGHDIAVVYSQPARPSGRGKKPTPSPVEKAAREHGLQVRTPETLKTEEELAFLESLQLDAAIVVAYGQILTKRALAAPKYGCLNIHASLLPRWRGAAPIQRAVMAGDQQTGVCIMQMEAGLDTGPVFARAETPISASDTAASLHDRLATLGADLLDPVLTALETGTAVAEPQSGEGVTYAHKIDKAEAQIDWSLPARDVRRHIHGLSPFPGAWTLCGDTRLKLLEVRETEGSGIPGTVLDDTLTVACGEGAIQIDRAQRPGKGGLDRETFLRGFQIASGTRLG